MLKKLKKSLPFSVNFMAFNERDGFKFLDIEIDDSDLSELEKKSKIISNLIDELDDTEEQYYLNVYSSGTEKPIEVDEIDNFLEEYISVTTSKDYLSKTTWEGELKSCSEDQVVLFINNKGRFQKLAIDKASIVSIKKTAKLKKGNL